MMDNNEIILLKLKVHVEMAAYPSIDSKLITWFYNFQDNMEKHPHWLAF